MKYIGTVFNKTVVITIVAVFAIVILISATCSVTGASKVIVNGISSAITVTNGDGSNAVHKPAKKKNKAKQSNSDGYVRNIVKNINQMKPEGTVKTNKSATNAK